MPVKEDSTNGKSSRSLADQIYGYLAEDEDARVCLDIPDSACDEQPRAFTLQLVAQTLTKVGDALASARLVLAWMLASLAAPAIFIALLVPLRESLALVPQLFIAQVIRQRPIRKSLWVMGSIGQGLALSAMLPVVLLLEGFNAGLAIILLLSVFSLSRGVCSVAAKDVLGKTISKTRRGRLTGYAAAAAGLVTLLVATALLLGPLIEETIGPSAGHADTGYLEARLLFVILLGSAALLWFAAAVVYGRIPEVPGAVEGGGNAITEAFRSLSIIKTDAGFRQFVIARALLVSIAFSIPYLVVMIQKAGSGDVTNLGALLLADGAAGLISGRFWGRWSDSQSHRVMAVAAALGVGAMLAALLLDRFIESALGHIVVAGSILFVAAVSHQGARVARKTYLVDMATTQNRARYTAVSNTVIGLFLFSGAGLGLIDAYFGTSAVLWLLVVTGMLAVFHSLSLKSVT